jgi:hypothetical protein
MAAKNGKKPDAVTEPRNIVCPYTGKHLDFDSLPGHSSVNHRPGKWSDTMEPLDEVALSNLDLSAMEAPEAKRAMLIKYLAAVGSVNTQLGAEPKETSHRIRIRAMAKEHGIAVVKGAEDDTPPIEASVKTPAF